jgi:hypothetical protein
VDVVNTGQGYKKKIKIPILLLLSKTSHKLHTSKLAIRFLPIKCLLFVKCAKILLIWS